jgi:hypothetical protein
MVLETENLKGIYCWPKLHFKYIRNSFSWGAKYKASYKLKKLESVRQRATPIFETNTGVLIVLFQTFGEKEDGIIPPTWTLHPGCLYPITINKEMMRSKKLKYFVKAVVLAAAAVVVVVVVVVTRTEEKRSVTRHNNNNNNYNCSSSNNNNSNNNT